MTKKLTPPLPATLRPLPEEGPIGAAAVDGPACPRLHRRARAWVRRHPTAVTVIGSLAVLGALGIAVWDQRGEFAAALTDASPWVLAAAAGLQLVWLIGRSEAWHVCVAAAGGSVERRRLYRASALGYLANVFNPSLGLAVRIAALRRSAPADSPRATVLIAAELPIVVVEIALAALLSFTLVAPLGLPLWIPPAALAVAGLGIALGGRLVRDRREGFWKGLEVMRGLASRNRIIALVVFAVSMQVVRNWLILHGLGIDVSVLDCVALLIATAALGLLPVGPGLLAACAVLILGSNGVAIVAAAGALLTVTGVAGAACFALWALADRLRAGPARGEPTPLYTS